MDVFTIVTGVNTNTLSSLVYVTNILHLYFRERTGYYFLIFCLLVLSSIVYHQTKNVTLKRLDRIIVYALVITGGIITYYSEWNVYTMMVVATFLATLFLFYGPFGICDVGLCKIENNEYTHALMHCVSSLGHHAIIANMGIML